MPKINGRSHRGIWLVFLSCLLIIAVLSGCASAPISKDAEESGVQDPTKDSEKKGWTLTFEDTFTGESLDNEKWQHAPEWQRHNGQWSNQDAYLNGEGQLVIQISERDGQYYSGAIRSMGLFEQAYGYYEIRARLPIEEGLWTAFWLMSDSVHLVGNEGKDGTEIDIFESPFARYNVIEHALHWDGYDKDHKSKGTSITVPEAYEDFTTFALEWNEEEYIFYINDVETWRSSAGGVSQVPAYLKITAEVGDWAGDITKANLPAQMLVDYVRVYEKEQ
ncbi:glycoside hydrolase family 16 protein [Sporosarcina sp. YIM B06819]|uniref:glycoside hydrolase family 16 protein n=1 Tax=Sporosarcina sp. YIM B06819 TaxID=3081769 RepID=UPI00298C314A|nr:glycoside hydrolase family 16 protein [Sporosarcina sp. YIM B06819]